MSNTMSSRRCRFCSLIGLYRCGLVAVVWSLWFGRCGFALLVSCCGLVSTGQSICQAVAVILSLWVNFYDLITLKDLRKFLQENSLTHAHAPNIVKFERRIINAGTFDLNFGGGWGKCNPNWLTKLSYGGWVWSADRYNTILIQVEQTSWWLFEMCHTCLSLSTGLYIKLAVLICK